MIKIKLIAIIVLLFSLKLFGQSPKEELTRLVESYKIPDNFKWYNPEQKYIRITTNQDKIYIILADSILTYEPSFAGKSIKYFHLLHKGKEIPIYIGSSNEIFDLGDTIIFVGSRPVGDTTWFDPYSNYEAFFLTYNEKVEGLRFGYLNNGEKTNPSLNFLDVAYHFEEHHQYAIGQPEHSSQTVNGEGWVWALLSPGDDWVKDDRFSFVRQLYPSESNDSVSFRFFALSAKFDSNYTKHNIVIVINGDTAYKNTFPGGSNIDFTFKYPTSKIILGENKFEILSRPSFKPDGKLAPNVVGFQFFEYSAKDLPFAQNGFVSTKIEQNTSNVSLEINNFRTDIVYAVDTVGKEFTILKATPTISFWASLLNKSVSINFNDSLIASNQRGIHLVAMDSVTKSLRYLFYPEENTKVVSDVKSLSNNSVYLVIFNGSKISSDVVNFFQSEGSNAVIRTKDGFAWIFAKKIGTNEKFETVGNTTKITLEGKFNAAYSNRYTISLNFNTLQKEKHLYLSDGNALGQAKFRSVSYSNLFETNRQADVIVIAPKVFGDVAQKYIEYRKTTNPEKNFFLAFAEDIFKEFNYGKKSSDAIKRFLVWAYYKWQKPSPKYLVIIGDASRDPRNVLEGSIYRDFVPTFGYPATDVWYAFLEGNDFIPDIHVGRIPITTPQEGYEYLNKIKEYDEAMNAPWMKKFLFLSGGTNQLEREYFFDRLQGDFADFILKPSPVCVRTQVIRKSDEVVGSEADASFIRSAINEGVQFMIFAGHGSAKVFDTDGWKVQTLNNKGKYGFFASFSCNTANFAEPTLVSRNEEYVTFPDKGFVGTLGSGGVGLRLQSLLLATYLLESIADSTIKTDYFIDLVDIAKEKMIRGYVDFENILTIYHYVYLGDPLLRMRIKRKPDLYFINNKVDITNELGKTNFTQSDSLFIIRGEIGNIGFSRLGNYSVLLIHTYNGQSDTLKRTIRDLCNIQEFQFQIPIGKKIGLHNFTIQINPERKIDEYDFANNSLSYNIEVYRSSLFPVEPLSNWNVDAENPLFRFIDPNFEIGRDTYKFTIFPNKNFLSQPIYKSKIEEINASPVRIDWRPGIRLPEGNFWLFAEKTSSDTTIKTQNIWIPFNTAKGINDSTVVLSFSTKDEFDNSDFAFSNLYFDTIENCIRVKPLRIPYKIMSCSGNARSERGKEITVNNKVYVTMAPDLDIVGFHAVIISHKDFSLERYVIFETWGTEPPEKDSSSIHLVRFLRDSVPERDYIFIVAHNSALRVPIAHQLANPASPGSLDSLRQVLREWGCKFADSLGSDLNRYGNSFFMVGRVFNGEKILLDEGFDLDGDSVESQGFITQIPSNIKITSPIIGPAKSWKTLNINFSLKDTSVSFKTKVFGYSIPNNYQKDLLAEVYDDNYIDISSSTYQKHPFLQFETTFSNPEESVNIKIKKIHLEFVPTPEIALKIDFPMGKKIDTLRGEEIPYITSVYNLSTRVAADSIRLSLFQKSASQNTEYSSQLFNSISKNSNLTTKGVIITDKFDKQTNILFTIQSKFPELYQFNNTESLDFSIREDSEKPSIVLYLDGMRIKGGEYVSKAPNIYIEVFDNSRLPFDTNSVSLLVNINKVDLKARAQFVNYGKNIPLKCTYTLTSDELEYGLNHFTIYTTDPSGNRDTFDVPVYVARKAKIQNFSVGPNPTTSGITFFINYISPKSGATAVIDIFDIVGNKIRTISKPISLNEDYVYWDGLDSDGRSVSQGVYFFKISVVGEIYSEPVYGKFLKIQ